MNKSKLNKNQVGNVLLDNLFWVLGCILYSTGVTFFAVPNKIAQSGITGVAILVNYLIKTPIGITNFVLNVPLFILAWIFVGKRFTIKTLWVTLMLSGIMDLTTWMIKQEIFSVYKGDVLLAAIFCGACCGTGISLVFLRNATTGGTDVVMRLLRKIWPNISMGRLILVVDTTIVVVAAIVYHSVESALYAAIEIFISTKVIDYVMYGSGNGKMLMIFTKRAKDVSAAITGRTTRGVSIVPIEGGFTGEHKNLLICVVRNNEVSKIRRLVKAVDRETFIVVTEARAVLGQGFKPPADDSDIDDT